MKTFLKVLFITTLYSSPIFSQSDISSSFSIENTGIVWIKIFETTLTNQELVDEIKLSGVFNEHFEIKDNKIVGDLRELQLDYKTAGYNGLNTPMFLVKNNFMAFAIVEIKENKYRVTVKKMYASNSSKLFLKDEIEYSIDKMYFKENKIKSNFKVSGNIIDSHLSRLFKFEKKESKEW